MSTSQISGFPNGSADALTVGTKILIESSDGTKTRHITIQELLEFMGVQVGTLASLTATGDNRLGFGSDVRKGAEGAGARTGSLVMGVNQTGWDRVEDNSAAAV